jgi:hypothetical protein
LYILRIRPCLKEFKIREKLIARVEEKYCNGEPMTPNVGKKETECLDFLEKGTGLRIERQKKICGYFLDGYVSSKNLVVV